MISTFILKIVLGGYVMDHTKISGNPCLNSYTEQEFQKYFAVDDEELKNCEKCPYIGFEFGILTCHYFSKKGCEANVNRQG